MGNNEDSEEEYDPTQDRGTASRGNPLIETAGDEDYDEPYIRIEDPNTGDTRVYKLNESVKENFESLYEHQLETLNAEWYETWWEGTKLVVEYEGPARTPEMRENEEMPPGQRPRKRSGSAAGMGGMFMMVFGGGPRIQVDVDEYYDGEDFGFDRGLFSVHRIARFDLQERADARPLRVEDLFIEPWNDDDAQEPVKNIEGDGSTEAEMEFHDEKKAGRGKNWNI